MADIFGQKGGGKGGSAPVESPNTLSSTATARIVDLVSEGPVVGLQNGLKDIFYDDVPLQNDDDTFNFSGLTIYTREGLPDQAHIPGFPEVETEISVSAPVTTTIPVTRTVSDDSVDAVRFRLQAGPLFEVEDDGDIKPTEVTLRISVRNNGGSFVEERLVTISGKSSGAYEKSIRVELDQGAHPWDIRVERVTPDSTSSRLSNATTWASYTEIVDAKLSYPDSALVATEVSAKQFGSRIPERKYRYRGLITPVPSNYDPIARTYTGVWDGTFVNAWHSNPAWVLYALMTNTRWGLGDLLDTAFVNKFALYEIGRYCDELVPDGKGGTEPRYSFNGTIKDRREATKVLDAVSSVFRGMIYWGSGTVNFAHDAPSTPTKLVTPANVLDGEFSYASSPLSSRSSSVAVTWNNPEDFGRQSVLVIQDDSLIQQFGDKRKSVTASGCTSRGQARRVAEWLLYTEAFESEIVSYRASLDHADVRPGQIIAISDPMYSGQRLGGRLVSFDGATGTFTLDAAFDAGGGGTGFSITVISPDGTLSEYAIDSLAPGEHSTVSSAAAQSLPLGDRPQAGSVYVITTDTVEPRLYRVVSVTESEDNVYTISGQLHLPGKYAFVERDVPMDDTDIFPPVSGRLFAPLALTLSGYRQPRNGAVSAVRIIAGWQRAPDSRVEFYRVWIKEPGAPERWVADTENLSIDILSDGNSEGVYSVRVSAISYDGITSPSISQTFDTATLDYGLLAPTNWVGQGYHQTITLAGDPYDNPEFKAFRIYGATDTNEDLTLLGEANTSVFVRSVPDGDTYTRYRVSALLHSGQESPLTAFIAVVPVPSKLIDLDASVQAAIDSAQADADQALQDAQDAINGVAGVEGEVTQLRLSTRSNLPTTFDSTDPWNNLGAGDPDGFDNPLTDTWGVENLSGLGKVAYTLDLTTPGSRYIYTRGVISPVAGRTYRTTVMARYVGTLGTDGNGDRISIAIIDLDSAYAFSGVESLSGYPLTNTFQTYTTQFTADGSEDAFIRGGITTRPDATGTGRIEVLSIAFEDITDEQLTSDALQSLTVRVTDNEGDISTQASAVTSLQSDLSSAEGDILANSSAINTLTTRVTDNEGDISTQATNISSLSSSVGGLNSSVSVLQTAQADLDSALAGYVVSVETNDGGATFEMVARQVSNGQEISRILLTADNIDMVGDVVIDGTLDILKKGAPGTLKAPLNPVDFEAIETTTGSFQFKTAGSAIVYLLGAGGGGGAARANGRNKAAAGGGAGGTCIKFFPEVNLSTNYQVSLASGALGGVASADNTRDLGNNAGQSRFWGPGVDLRANGGTGGNARRSLNDTITAEAGLGGSATGGDLNYTGGRGGNATASIEVGCATGGGALNFGLNGAGVSPNCPDLTNSDTNGNNNARLVSLEMENMTSGPVPFIKYDGREFYGTVGRRNENSDGDSTRFCGGGGGCVESNTGAEGGRGGDAICFVYYFGDRSFI